jgi:hypothetical protein
VLGVEGKDQLPGWASVGSGAAAGGVSLTLVYPFDVVRRRMQTHKGGAKYPGVFAAFKTIYATEGLVHGLYRGLSLNYVRASNFQPPPGDAPPCKMMCWLTEFSQRS